MSILRGLLSILNLNSFATGQQTMVHRASVLVPPERTFGGVPLSELNKLAKEISHGLYCNIDKGGFLIFHYKSNRGHQIFHVQMNIGDGRLVSLGGHYPGQCWSGADEFAKRANEMFHFTGRE